MNVELLIPYIGAIATMLVSVFVWIFTKPTDEEKRINQLRKNLLVHLRFKTSYELSKSIPIKEDVNFEDYMAIVTDALNSYLSSNSSIMIEIFSSENLFKSYIKTLRIFKYAVIIIPIICMIFFLFIKFILLVETIYIYIYIVVACIMLLMIILIFMERKKDKYHDLCTRYEVMND